MPLAPLALRRDPTEVLACLADEPGAFLLEIPDDERPAALLGCRPVAEVRLAIGERDPMGTLARFVAHTPVADAALPFPLGGGVVACLAYELGVEIAPRRIVHHSVEPLAVLRRTIRACSTTGGADNGRSWPPLRPPPALVPEGPEGPRAGRRDRRMGGRPEGRVPFVPFPR